MATPEIAILERLVPLEEQFASLMRLPSVPAARLRRAERELAAIKDLIANLEEKRVAALNDLIARGRNAVEDESAKGA